MKIVSECAARGHTITIFTLRWEAPAQDDVPVEIVPIVGFNRHSQYEHFAEFVNQRAREIGFDLVVGFNKMPGLDIYYGGDSCYIEKALLQRDAWYRLLPRFKSFHAAERAVYDKYSTTQILAISDVETPRYRHYYQTQPDRIHLLPPGIEHDRIAPADKSVARHELRAEFGLREDQLLLLFIGSGFIKKGLDRALLAMAALPKEIKVKTHLMIIGRDKGDAFERMTMRLGLTKQVTFFTEGRDDVPRFLFAADALLHPAYDETAGMVIVEAMLAGVPVLATKNCGYAKYLNQHQAGIVLPLPFSQEDLNQALLELLTSPMREQWQAHGIAAKSSDELFQLVPKAVDIIEVVAKQREPLLIFVLFHYFPYGGLQRDFLRIALACQAEGFQVRVYCMSWQGEQPSGFDIEIVEEIGVANHTRQQHFAQHISKQAKWYRPCAIVGFNRMPGLDFYYAADSCFEHKAQAMRSAIYRRTERYRLMSSYERAVFADHAQTQIMLIAPDQKEQFQKYYQTSDERLVLLPPGVNRDRCRADGWQQQRAQVRAEFEIDEGQYLLLLVGSGFITKGLDRVLNMVASLPSPLAAKTRLLVIGQDNPQQFRRQARLLGIHQQVSIVKGRDDIPAILQAADIMVHPAYMESGGMVLIEAVIAGLPVIASGVCGFASYIQQAQAGLVLDEPFDQQNFNATVENLLVDKDRRVQLSFNGVQYGVDHPELYDMPSHALAFIKQKIKAQQAS